MMMIIILLKKFIYVIRNQIGLEEYEDLWRLLKSDIEIICTMSIKILIAFDMAAEMSSNTKIYQIKTELFVWGTELNICTVSNT